MNNKINWILPENLKEPISSDFTARGIPTHPLGNRIEMERSPIANILGMLARMLLDTQMKEIMDCCRNPSSSEPQYMINVIQNALDNGSLDNAMEYLFQYNVRTRRLWVKGNEITLQAPTLQASRLRQSCVTDTGFVEGVEMISMKQVDRETQITLTIDPQQMPVWTLGLLAANYQAHQVACNQARVNLRIRHS